MIAQTVLNYANSGDQLRKSEIQQRWKAYTGKLDKPLKVKSGQTDDNCRLNYCGNTVDIGVSFLFGENIDFEVDFGKPALTAKQIADDDDDSGEFEPEPPEQVWLEAMWEANNKMTLLMMLGINGGVCGHSYIRVHRSKNVLEPYPRMTLVDPQCVRVVTDQDDYNKVLCYVIEWNAVDPDSGQAMTRRTTIQQDQGNGYWSIKDEKSIGNTTTWQLIGIENWPFRTGPIFQCQNLPMPNEFWGRSDLEEDVVEVNSAINFTKSNTNRILKHHAHPKTWGTGFQERDLDVSVDSTLIFPNPLAKLANLEMVSDLGSSILHADKLKEAFYEMVSIPGIALGNLESIGALSGTALDILHRPIAKKTGKKRLIYGDMLKRLNSFLLVLGGFAEGLKIKIGWADTIPQNVLEEAQAAVILETLGVSKDTLITEMGYDARIEAAKKAKERQTEAEFGADLMDKFDKGGLDGGGSNQPGQQGNNNQSGSD